MRNQRSKSAPQTQPEPGDMPPDWVKHVYCPNHACGRARRCLARNKKLSCKSRRKFVPEAERNATLKEVQAAFRITMKREIFERARMMAAGEPVEMFTSQEIGVRSYRDICGEIRSFKHK